METSDSQLEASSDAALGEKPSFLLWVIGFLVSTLMAGSFFLTGLFIAVGTGNKATLMGGVLMGFLPALAGCATFGGLVYAIYEPWAKRAVAVAMFTIVFPIVVIPFFFGFVSWYALVLAPVGAIIGGFGMPGLVWAYRKRGFGKVKAPKGSWEDNF